MVEAGTSATFSWAVSMGGRSDDNATALAVRGTNVYVAGYFSNIATFGSIGLTGTTVVDLFLAKLTDAGASAAFSWVQQASGSGYVNVGGLVLNGTTVYVAGEIDFAAHFGSILLPAPNRNAAFLAALTDPTLTATTGPRTALAFDLFPNPAPGGATVQVPPVPGATQAIIQLCDALGRVLRTEAVALPAAGLYYLLPLAGLPAGVYAVKVSAGEYTVTRRLVVE